MQRLIPLFAMLVVSGCAHSVWFDNGVGCDAGDCVRADAAGPRRDTATSPDTGTAVEEDTAPIAEDTAPREDTRPPDPTGDPCMDCASAKCASEISACFADPSCKDLNDCFGTCSDETCASDCYARYPSPTYDAFVSCAMSKCSAECS